MTSRYMQSSGRHKNRTQMARRFGFLEAMPVARDDAFSWTNLPATILWVRTPFPVSPGRHGLRFRLEFSETPVRQRQSIHGEGKRVEMRRDIQGGTGSATVSP